MKNFSARPGSLSSEKRKLLELRLRQKGISSLEKQAIPRRKEMSSCPLSFAQQRLWFLNQLEPESTFYLISYAWRFRGNLSSKTLEKSLEELVRRHESLRTTFSMQLDQPVQIIHPVASLVLPVVDLQGLVQEQRETVARYLIKQDTQYPCDLAKGPLLRLHQLRLEAQDHVLLMTLHHIITDGWSNEVLMRELTILYYAFIAGQSSPLAALPIQYADYALWQREWLQGEVLEQQLAYWRRHLAEAPPLGLPSDYPRPAMQTLRGASQRWQLPLVLSQELQALSQREQVTLFMTLLASFQVLLMRYSGQSDISVGTPIANRQHAEIESVIGFFVNTLVLRTDLSGNPSFVEVLRRVREVCLGAYTHQEVPFEQVVEVLEPKRDLSRSPLFQVMFVLQNVPQEQGEAAGIQVSSLNVESVNSPFDLALSIAETEHGLHCSLQYNTDLFEAQTIQRLLRYWQALLEGVLHDPQLPVWQVSLLSAEEHTRLLAQGSTTLQHAVPHLSVHQRFEQQVQRTPEAIALIFEEHQLSYGELNRRANQLAHFLRARGVGPEMVVGICLERSFPLLIALLAVLKTGGAYLPLDPTYPHERLATLLRDARISMVLTTESVRERLPEDAATLLCVETQEPSLQRQSSDNLPLVELPDHLLYLISTSGSTGLPKGAGVTRRGFGNLLDWFLRECAFTPQTRVLVATSFSFDLTQKNLLAALLVGGSVTLFPSGYYDPQLVCQTIAQQAITFMNCVPTMLYPLLDQNQAQGFAAFSSLQLVFMGGEALSIARLLPWLRSSNCQTKIISAYGPTECTDIVSSLYLEQPEQYFAAVVPVGRAIPNARLYVLDGRGNLALEGSVGELSVGGEGVARGYLKHPDITAERFVPDAFSGEAGARLYRTGDLVRSRLDGTLEFVGREDQQVKIRGYRIELGEIEAVLGAHLDVQEQVVLAREDVPGDTRLVAYVVGQPGPALTSTMLRSWLQERLPSFMLPWAFVFLDALPLTPNGKVDRRKLPRPEENHNEVQEEAKTQFEELVVGLWSEVLGRSQLRRHENFFELGGHSLLATRLVARIAATLGVEVPVRTVFEEPTIAGFAQRVEQALLKHKGEMQIPPLVAGVRPERISLSFAQQRLWLLDQLQTVNTAYIVSYTHYILNHLNTEALDRSLEETIQRHESLRTTFTTYKGQPIQIIHPVGHYCLPLVDVCGLAPEQRKREGQKLVRQEMQLPFDLEQGPLMRTYLLRLDDEEHILLLTLHHIITDGRSTEVLMKEVLALYQAFVHKQPSPLAPLPIQYADYALWQRKWLQGEMLETQLEYWTRRLGGAPPIELPTDYPRPSIASTHGASHFFSLSAELSQALTALSRRENMTLFMTLLAAFQVLFYRYTRQSDIVIGTDSANRNRVETEGIVGFFVNLLVLRTDLSGNPTFREVLKRVREVTLGAYAHQDAPFELLVEKLAADHYLDRIPLVQVLFVFKNRLLEIEQSVEADQQNVRKTVHPLSTSPMIDGETEVKFDLALFMEERHGKLSGVLNYRLDSFKESTIATMIARFEVLLQSSVKQPDIPIDLLDITLDTERTQYEQGKQKRRQALHVHNDGLFDIPNEGFTERNNND